MRRIAGVLAVVALLALLPGPAWTARTPASSNSSAGCRERDYDVWLNWTVNTRACHYYFPGNQSVRGSKVPQRWLTECITVNDQFPGPTVYAKVGDVVRVDVTNAMLTKHVGVHWHGLKMKGTPWSDGTNGITTCPTPAGMTSTYIWVADEPGTFIWHGHGGLEEEYGFSGAIVIEDPADPSLNLYEKEYDEPFSIRDWWFAPDAHDAQGFTFRDYSQLFELVSLEVMGHSAAGIPLVNGFYGNGTDFLPYPVFYVEPDTCYRMRFITANTQWPGWLINITDMDTGNFANITLLEHTAMRIEPKNTHSFSVFIGQRADVVFCTKPTAGDYNMTFDTAQIENGRCNVAYPNVTDCIDLTSVILRVNGTATGARTSAKQAIRNRLAALPFVPVIDVIKNPELLVTTEPDTSLLRAHPSQTWVIDLGIVAGNMYAWDTRNWGLVMPRAPLLFTDGKCGVPFTPPPGMQPNFTFKKAYLEKSVRKGEVVDIIFNNLSPYIHPMHLHGNDFLLLGSKFIMDSGVITVPQTVCPDNFKWADPGFDNLPGPPYDFPFPLFGCPYNASDPTNSQYMLHNPISTDTIAVPARSWTYARVRFDNPGYWFLHCHVTIHMVMGMGFVVKVSPEQTPPVPSWVDTSCLGRCQPQRQVCGPYARAKDDIVRCVAPKRTDYCPPSDIVDLWSMGPGGLA